MGFQILEAIDTAGRFQGTLQANSDLAIATFPCMSLGTATLPTDLTEQLGDNGAFGVRGRPFESGDGEKVIAHDDTWIIEPPVDSTWQDITTVEARIGITGSTADLFLALGKPGSNTGFVGTGDELLATTFDWTTIPKATFGNPFVVVGQCVVGDGFLQHFPASSSSAEIVGFVEPTQCPGSELTLERAPRTFAERLFRALSPTPAYATALLREDRRRFQARPQPLRDRRPGRGQPELDQPVAEQERKRQEQAARRRAGTVRPIRRATAGCAFKQPGVLTYLTVIDQTSSHAAPLLQLGLQRRPGRGGLPPRVLHQGRRSVIAPGHQTVGTVTYRRGCACSWRQGRRASAPQFNVKNSRSCAPTGKCPVFDGTTYFTNILNPSAPKFTFDPQDASTFPPNLDVVTFP